MSTKIDANKEEVIDEGQMSECLLMQWLEQQAFLSEQDKNTLFEMGCAYLNDVAILYNVNKVLLKKEGSFSDEENKLILKINQDNDQCTLIFDEEKLELEIAQLREIIAGMIDILEKILPLGTVVDLKKEYLQQHIQVKEIANIRIVITHRFLYHEDDTTYFPYAGVVYPVGMFENRQMIHFTAPLIEKVVYPGYSDEQEEAYIYLMKHELIVEKRMHSYGFSTEEERDSFEKKMKPEGEKENVQS